MTAPIYATLDDYRTWVGDEASTVSAGVLRSSSRIVDELLFGAVYALDDTTQIATDTDVRDAIRDATCAQAQWMDAAGDTAGVGDVVLVNSASIGSVSYSGAARASAAGTTRTGAEIAPGTLRELTSAGLSPTVWVCG